MTSPDDLESLLQNVYEEYDKLDVELRTFERRVRKCRRDLTETQEMIKNIKSRQRELVYEECRLKDGHNFFEYDDNVAEPKVCIRCGYHQLDSN